MTLNGTVAPKDIEASFISGASKEPTGDREQMLQSLKTFPSPKNVKRFPKHLWRSHSSNFFTSNKTDFKAMPETWSSGVTFENALDKLWKEVDRFNSLTPETSDVASDIVAKIDTHLASKNYIGAMPTKLPERIQKQVRRTVKYPPLRIFLLLVPSSGSKINVEAAINICFFFK